METLFHRGWTFVGHTSEIPRTGDYVLRRIGRQNVVFVRDEHGDVQVLLNRCSHRGNMLLWQEAGNTRRAMTCAYHGWSFNLRGTLIGVPYDKGLNRSREELALARAVAVEQYRGFVFACLLAHPAVDLAGHLGPAVKLIDRTCDLSPEGEIDLSAGWLKHSIDANWKLVADNNTDGYHVGFVHRSFLQAFSSQYETSVGRREEELKGVTRDWGGGHGELEFASTYQRPLDWLTGREERYANYAAAMEDRYGKERARQMLFDGPSHATIFPNLFLGEMNVEILQPTAADRVTVAVSPLLLKGAPEVNRRSLQQTPAAMGPAAFLFADDAVLAERNQIGLTARRPEWVDLGRGLNRQTKADGVIEGHFTDEVSARAFWLHYAEVMRSAA
ncbi:MAG TPA: aromatic ring-hydroxylating dioxygenase subunit alpha [Burkholderiaceae bacterium]|nr:aromatic ring-hydroxylating dioxygenase subunit alpha [Burkholderiaceae bacterium]